MTVPLDLIAGRERAAAFIADRVQQLVTQDCIPQSRAYEMVCTAVLAADPFTLAAPGQLWIARVDEPDSDVPAAMLYVHRRQGADVLLEDECGQQEWLPVSVLDGYVLDTWHSPRQDAER